MKDELYADFKVMDKKELDELEGGKDTLCAALAGATIAAAFSGPFFPSTALFGAAFLTLCLSGH